MLACYIVQAAGLSQFLRPPFMQLQFVCLSVRKLIPSAPSFSVAFTHSTQQDWCPPTSFADQPCFCHLHQAHCSPPLLRSISQCAYATHQAVSYLNRLFFHPTLKIKNKPALSPVDVPDPCAYCRGRLPLLPVVATLRLPPSLNSRSARAHNFGNTPSSYVFPRFFPTLAQGCFPFSFLGCL
jgi:hypothetical protein